MVCFHPLTGYRAPGGKVTFSRKGGYIDRPVTVSCGQCTGCRLERSRQWAVRCMHEASQHERNCFLTLTYNNENLPEDRSVDVSEWQRFVKRARKRMGPFRYFHCGEYGDITNRPHYHACLFGIDFRHDRREWKTSRGNALYRSESLEELWTLGHSVIGEVTFESAAYVARYVMKKVTGANAEEHYGGRKPEYTTMSRRPGLGKAWLEKFKEEVLVNDSVIINRKEVRPPRFYDSQFEITDPELFKAVKTARVRKAIKYKDNNTADRLETRERFMNRKLEVFKREGTEG